jgi:hypothetical protein
MQLGELEKRIVPKLLCGSKTRQQKAAETVVVHLP